MKLIRGLLVLTTFICLIDSQETKSWKEHIVLNTHFLHLQEIQNTFGRQNKHIADIKRKMLNMSDDLDMIKQGIQDDSIELEILAGK